MAACYENCEQFQLGGEIEYATGYMLDANIFDKVLDNKINADLFLIHPHHIVVTHIQKDELEKTPDAERRAALLEIFNQVAVKPTAGFIWGVSKWGQCTWGDDVVLKKRRHDTEFKIGTHDRDALIAYTAFKKGLTLVTEDKRLLKDMESVEEKAIDCKSFLERIRR